MHQNGSMGEALRGGTILVAILLTASVTFAHAQTAGALQKPRLSLGIAAGTDDVETELQLKLALPAGVALGKIEAELTFPADKLKFERIAGYLVDQRRVKVATKVVPATPGKSTLLLTVESPDPSTPLPVDALAKVVFKVEKGVKPTVLDVGLQAKVFAPAGQEVSPVEVYPGRINIQERSVFFGCFFYMH